LGHGESSERQSFEEHLTHCAVCRLEADRAADQLSTLSLLFAFDGQRGLEYALTDNYDLVILDWTLPSLSGPEILQQLRQHTTVPVLMLTGRDDEKDIVHAFQLGADDYVRKPFSPKAFVARVNALLRRQTANYPQQVPIPAGQRELETQQEQTVLKFANLIIDRSMCRVELNQTVIPLSDKECDLLWLLAMSPERVFDRTELLDRVWGRDFFGNPRVIDVTISNLRKKIHFKGNKILHTVRNVGYKFQINR
ncbi:MAG: response regulator transcription factor, partial [Deinococcota bacterium]